MGTCLCFPSHGSWHLGCDPHKPEVENWETEFRNTFAEYASHNRLKELAYIEWAIDFISALLTQRDAQILKWAEERNKEIGIKMYPDKRTGEMRYLHGNSPSSQCVGCGQKKKAEEQGFNSALTDLKTFINKNK